MKDHLQLQILSSVLYLENSLFFSNFWSCSEDKMLTFVENKPSLAPDCQNE